LNVLGDIFQTERLRVRHITDEDAKHLYAVYGDAEAMRWVDDGEPIAWEDCGRWVDVTLRNYEMYGYGMSAVVLKSSDTVIGFCGIVHPGGQQEAEIKYAFLRAYWGQGFATEVVRSMIAYGENHFALRRIIATIDPDNGGSRRVLIKSGMSYCDTQRHEDGSYTEILDWCAIDPGITS
jgi:RimJ/RimL family protein N-acetyltransferase